MSWSNQDIILYHGTVASETQSILASIDLQFCRPRSDFGLGFYLTTSKTQAETLAANLPTRLRYLNEQPAVIEFVVERERLASLDSLAFVRGTPDADDYWDLVNHFRVPPYGFDHRRIAAKPWYDVVIGPVCINWKLRKTLSDADQYSFHTPDATQVLDQSTKRLLP